ncbi:ClpX C4-type zinc finger protein [Pontivivens ytuae]|uniref:ClpX C4-type zinc finger protein n=1 Tax=Pontivivens ytuae TaxID=2789856 RepID=A0A7S9QCG3_9RHOB|nr:ClpX C4-type zinc finger protein [Pontivivens ytuae]QPH53795.1 ClpX C4-type zinc finger protein [Pontivivens ytuae]
MPRSKGRGGAHADDGFHCAFCGLDNTSVGKMIAGPGVAICDRCVDACNAIIARNPGSDAPSERGDEAESAPFGAWSRLPDDVLLSTVRRTDRMIHSIRSILRDQVAVLRDRGVSWSDIGRELGISRQSAHERFASSRTDRS